MQKPLTEKEKIDYFNWYLGFERIFGLPEKYQFEIKLAQVETPPNVKSFRSVPVKDRNEAFSIIENMIIPADANGTWRSRTMEQMATGEFVVNKVWLHVIRYDL